MPLYHSISEYRKQQVRLLLPLTLYSSESHFSVSQSQSATPVRQIRNPEIQPTSISEEYEAPTESNRITIQQQIRNLQEEVKQERPKNCNSFLSGIIMYDSAFLDQHSAQRYGTSQSSSQPLPVHCRIFRLIRTSRRGETFVGCL